jgi:hypothetical protein
VEKSRPALVLHFFGGATHILGWFFAVTDYEAPLSGSGTGSEKFGGYPVNEACFRIGNALQKSLLTP